MNSPLPPGSRKRSPLGIVLTVFVGLVVVLVLVFVSTVVGVSMNLHSQVTREKKEAQKQSLRDAQDDLARFRLAAQDGRVSDEELYWVTLYPRDYQETASEIRLLTGRLLLRGKHPECYGLVVSKPLGPRSRARLIDGGPWQPGVFPTVRYGFPTTTPSSVLHPDSAPN